MESTKKDTGKGFYIFKRISENKKAIEKAIKEGKSITKIKSIKIAKPL